MYVCVYLVHTSMHVCVCLWVTLDAACACFIKGAQIWSLGYYFQWLAALQAAVKWKWAGQPALPVMFTASERSCHVSWQLTQWVWVPQCEVGLFLLCLYFLGNMPSSCCHIDLITQPWWQLGKDWLSPLPAQGCPDPGTLLICPEVMGDGVLLFLGLERLIPAPTKTSQMSLKKDCWSRGTWRRVWGLFLLLNRGWKLEGRGGKGLHPGPQRQLVSTWREGPGQSQ